MFFALLQAFFLYFLSPSAVLLASSASSLYKALSCFCCSPRALEKFLCISLLAFLAYDFKVFLESSSICSSDRSSISMPISSHASAIDSNTDSSISFSESSGFSLLPFLAFMAIETFFRLP